MSLSVVLKVLMLNVHTLSALSSKSLTNPVGRSATKKMKIAVIGAGVAGCSAANTLATFRNGDGELAFHVSVFDSGRGAGGRCSTRRTKQDGVDIQFDHGAVYIGKPKTEEFASILDSWKNNGAIKEWIGAFADLSYKNSFGSFVNGADTGRYVGVPTMSEICKSMIDPCENIEQYYQHTVKPLHVPEPAPVAGKDQSLNEEDSSGQWRIVSSKNKEEEEVVIGGGGDFDWVILGDKKEVTSEILGTTSSSPSLLDQMPFKSVPVLAVMVTIDINEVVEKFPYDGVRLDGHPVLGWMSRETSKPWRERTDGKELWLLQSTVEFAQQIIHSIGNKGDAQDIKLAVASAAEQPLFDAFCSVIHQHELQELKHNAAENVKDAADNIVTTTTIPKPTYLRGHRWGAAFPASFVRGTEREGGRSYVDPNRCIAVVGDYFGTAAEGGARIEGACLSGVSAARGIIASAKAAGKI